MNIPDNISESLETIFELKILDFLMRIQDPESLILTRDEKIRIWDNHPGSATLQIIFIKSSQKVANMI